MRPTRNDRSGDSARPSARESIEATAAAWLAECDAGLSPADEKKFAAWRAADPRHEAAVARLEGAWAALQPLRDFRPAAARHPDRDLLAQPAAARVLPFPARACALVAAAALVLADGSVLELNGDTAAEVNFTSTERRVRLARGEAHFTVAKNPARPFLVEAQGVAVRAVGTAFNVRLGSREVEVLVTEGKVAVSEAPRTDSGALAPALRSAPPAVDTLLVANQRAVIATVRSLVPGAATQLPAPLVEAVAPAAVRDVLAWQGPRLVFVDTPLAEVVAQFNRRNSVQLVLADDSLRSLPVGGSFRPENVETFVSLLESGGDVTADRTDPARLVLRRAK